jgi:hypothetical protein
MASPVISKAVAGVQTALIHFQTVAAGVANRAAFRLPQKSKILRIAASVRASNATDLTVMAEAGGSNLLDAAIDVFPYANPAAPVAVLGVNGGAINVGTHSYKQTFVDAVGESAGSAKSNVITVALPAAPTAGLAGAGAGNVNNGTHSYKVTFVSATGESSPSAKSNVVNVVDLGADGQINLTVIPTGPAGTLTRNIYRSAAGDAGPWLLAGNIPDNVAVIFTDNLADAGLGAAAPATAGGTATVTITAGPAGTVSRKVYRTDAGDAGNAKLIATVAGNTVLSYADSGADGAGAAAPTIDTRSQGNYYEGTLVDAVAAEVAKETEITVDVDTLTGTNVLDLCVQIDLVRLD